MATKITNTGVKWHHISCKWPPNESLAANLPSYVNRNAVAPRNVGMTPRSFYAPFVLGIMDPMPCSDSYAELCRPYPCGNKFGWTKVELTLAGRQAAPSCHTRISIRGNMANTTQTSLETAPHCTLLSR